MIDFSWSKTVTLSSGREVILRYPIFEDAEKLMNFINPIVKENAHILLNQIQSLDQEKEYLASCIKSMHEDQMIKMCVYFEDRIVGAAHVTRLRYKENHAGEFGISLSQDFRGQGLGKILMSELIQQAKEILSVSQLILTCSLLNVSAQELYKKLGFQEYGRLPEALQYENSFVDQVLMYKKL